MKIKIILFEKGDLMTGKTHMLCGMAFAVGTSIITESLFPEQHDTVVSCFFIASSTFSALLADVDEKNSIAGRNLTIIPLLLYLLKISLFLIEIFCIGEMRAKIKKTRKYLRHRGVFHWLITWGTVSIIITVTVIIIFLFIKEDDTRRLFIPLAAILLGFIPGYISHLLVDLISGKIQILAPFSEKRYGIALFKVGGFAEKYIFRPALIIGNIYMFSVLL